MDMNDSGNLNGNRLSVKTSHILIKIGMEVQSLCIFRYSWTCAIMTTSVGTPPLPCLKDNTTLVSGARVLHINAADLEALPDVEVTNYLFNLTVMRPGRGFAWTSQVIQIQPRTTLKYVRFVFYEVFYRIFMYG